MVKLERVGGHSLTHVKFNQRGSLESEWDGVVWCGMVWLGGVVCVAKCGVGGGDTKEDQCA